MFVCLQILSPIFLPFTVERENMLLDALASVQRRLLHSNAYFRVSDAKTSQKEHTLWATLVVNRQSFKHGAGHITYKQVSIRNLRAETRAYRHQAVAGSGGVLAALVDAEPWLLPSSCNGPLSGLHCKSQGCDRSTGVVGCRTIRRGAGVSA